MAKGITAQEMDSATASGFVPHLGTTTNSGNLYSITSNTPISVNQKFTIKFNVAISTVPTLKINNDTALPIINTNGNNAKLYASVYTLFRDGSAFILQGEGGEYGSAGADQVLAPYTIGTDNGIVTGTIPDRGAGGTVTPNTADQTKAAGRYTSAITIKGEPNLIAGNLPKDKTFFGVTGLLERMTAAEKQAIANAITGKGVAASVNDTNTVLAQKIGQIDVKKYATGTFVSANSGAQFLTPEGRSTSSNWAVCSINFGFVPKFVIIMTSSYSINRGPLQGVYNEELKHLGYSIAVAPSSADPVRVDGVKAYVRSDGFLLPVSGMSVELTWHVFG